MRLAINRRPWAWTHVWNRIFAGGVYTTLAAVKFSGSAMKYGDRTVVEASDWRSVVLLHLKGSSLALWSEAGARPTSRQHMVTIRHHYSTRQPWNTLADTVKTAYGHEAEAIAEVCCRTVQAWLRLLTPDARAVRGGAAVGSVEATGRWIEPESDQPLDVPVPPAKMPDMAFALARVQLRRLSEFLACGADWSGMWWRHLIAVAGDAAGVVERRTNRTGFSQSVVSVPISSSLTESEIDVGRTLRKVVGTG